MPVVAMVSRISRRRLAATAGVDAELLVASRELQGFVEGAAAPFGLLRRLSIIERKRFVNDSRRAPP